MYKPLNKGLISPRTLKTTVAIVGFAEKTRHLVPYEDENTEIWGINDAYAVKDFMKRWDRWFQLHPLPYLDNAESLPRDKNHVEWLKQEHDFPIYMQEKYDHIPASVKYPLDAVSRKIGRKYLTSSFAFLFGLALLEDFQRIEIYGFEMRTFSEYAKQKPNAEYLIGLAEGRGIEVLIPAQSTLCKGPIYGYEDLDISFRQEMEYLKVGADENVKLQTNEFHRMSAQTDLLLELSKTYPELKERWGTLKDETDMKVAQINNSMGRAQEIEELIGLYDALKTKEYGNE